MTTLDRKPAPAWSALARAVALWLIVLHVGTAAAQVGVSGTLTGTLGGEERTWYAITAVEEGEAVSTATFMSIGGAFYIISIQGHDEPRFRVEGTLSVEVTMTGLPDPATCPCRADEASALYWNGSSMFSDLYEDEAAEVVFTVIALDGDRMRLEGEVRATLAYRASMTSGLDQTDTLELDATFEVDAVEFVTD
jgi:hypothetical protein